MKKTNRAVAMLLALLLLLPTLLFAFTSCGGNENKGPGNTPPGSESGEYTITVKTKGGMPFSKIPVYCFEYVDGELGSLEDFAMTDDNGVVKFELDPNKQYAASVKDNVPDGYNVQDFYPLVSADLKIELSSSLIKGEEISGKTFALGDIMYDFTLKDVDGNDRTLSDILKDKEMVLLNFWATWCGPCVNEFPIMESVYQEYKDDVAVVTIDSINTGDNVAAVKNFISEMEFNGTPLSFDFLYDADGDVPNAFGVAKYPTSVVIDRYGMISMIHAGSITTDRPFRIIFDHFTGDNYKQMIVNDPAEITPVVKPDVKQPSSDKISELLDGGKLNVEYTPDENEYSWPFIITEKDGVECIAPANGGKQLPDSYAIIYATVELEANEALAFDYFSSTEKSSDIMYVLVDDKDIYSISGVSTEWSTCYSFVALEAGTYELALCYMKDGSTDTEDDTVYVKNLRIVSLDEIDEPSYIYRFAATDPDEYNVYQNYITPVYNELDGYYHVGEADGPILLADLMGYTRFDDTTSLYYLAADMLADKYITTAEYNKFITYCNYASNASLNGICSVTEELAEILKKMARAAGIMVEGNEWLTMCCYYDAYGTDSELEDPIKGLAPFSAYPVIEGGAEVGVDTPVEEAFPNAIVYNRMIMPRGLLYKFTPEVSGTYRIASYSEYETNAWIFRESNLVERNEWLTYENVYRVNEIDPKDNNVYMIAYMEAGQDYYIDIAYYDVYQYGTIYFKVERLTSQDYPNGEGYYRFSSASPGYFTYYENEDETLDTNEIVAGGIDVELKNGYWYEKRNDGKGSLLFADFEYETGIFNRSIKQMINANAFDFSRTEYDQYVLNMLATCGGDKAACIEALKEEWGSDYATYSEIYRVDEVLAGKTHGDGTDYTEAIEKYLSKVIKVGYNEILGEEIKEGDIRIGCVIVDAELAQILQYLMDKYTFEGVENSWKKLCYYSQYFCAATPV